MSDQEKEVILNVDDNEQGRYVTTWALRQGAFEVREAATGTEALQLARTIPDLIVLDVNLPDINGFEVCRQLKADPATQMIPVLHLSATCFDDQSKIAGLDSGADGYLTQPIKPDVLLAYVKALLRARRAEKELRQSQRELQIRNKITSIFLTVRDDEMYGDVLEVVLEAMDSKYGMFGYIDEDGALVVPTLTRDIWDQCQIPDKKIVFPRETWGDSSWARAIREKKANYSNEHSALTPKGHIPMQRHLSMPIVNQGETVGLLAIANKETDYVENDVQLLQMIADKVAPVLAARLQREKQEKARRMAEKEREILIAKLESTNAELDQFTHTVSHDLKSPLNTIKGFMCFLKEDLAAGDGKAVEAHLARMAGAAEKMAKLLDELLALAQAGQVANPAEEVSFETIAKEAAELVAGRIAEAGIQVEIAADMPIIFGDRTRLVEVVQNLVENAVKWTEGRPEPRIEIGARQDGDNTVCYVRDNGVGIDPRCLEKVFGLFEKLDPKSKGTGMGLALAKRIIGVHGGQIWAESEGPGQGSTFCFTLPQKADT